MRSRERAADAAHAKVTRDLGLLAFEIPNSMEEVLSGGPSPFGWHSVSAYMGCPEASRLNALGIRPRAAKWVPGDALNALSYGNLIHAALAIRSVYSHDKCMSWLYEKIQKDLQSPDFIRASLMLRVYDDCYPEGFDPCEPLGIESTVHTDIGGVIRTVRYDGIVKVGNDIHSLERKTDSKGGFYAMQAYTPQAAVQAAIWNNNPHLVEKYGLMRGVIFDILVKSTVPRCERIPVIIPKHQQELVINYLKLTDQVRFPVGPDGSYPKMLHTCWGKYRPCEYVPLCWEQMHNQFEQVTK